MRNEGMRGQRTYVIGTNMLYGHISPLPAVTLDLKWRLLDSNPGISVKHAGQKFCDRL